MPALLVAAVRLLISLFIRFIGPMLLQALAFFGLSFITQNYVMQPFVNFITGALSNAPAMAIKSLAAVSFDKAVTIIISAYITAAAGRLLFRKTPAAPPAGG